MKDIQDSAKKFEFKRISPKIIERAYDNYILLNKSEPKYVLIPEHWRVTVNINGNFLGERWDYKVKNKNDGEKKYYIENTQVFYVNGLSDLKFLENDDDQSWRKLSTHFHYGRCSGFYE